MSDTLTGNHENTSPSLGYVWIPLLLVVGLLMFIMWRMGGGLATIYIGETERDLVSCPVTKGQTTVTTTDDGTETKHRFIRTSCDWKAIGFSAPQREPFAYVAGNEDRYIDELADQEPVRQGGRIACVAARRMNLWFTYEKLVNGDRYYGSPWLENCWVADLGG